MMYLQATPSVWSLTRNEPGQPGTYAGAIFWAPGGLKAVTDLNETLGIFDTFFDAKAALAAHHNITLDPPVLDGVYDYSNLDGPTQARNTSKGMGMACQAVTL
ncbi:MAG: hypothetical protein FWF28_09445 [Micrococcales bacterium]|nr:hypothetical protein [Micrococcales bacterium]